MTTAETGSTYTERRSAYETAFEFALLSFYHFNRSEPPYKSKRIKLLDVIAACSQLNVNALKLDINNNFSWGKSHRLYLTKINF